MIAPVNQLTNLVVRSKASFLHASCDVDDLVKKCKSLGHKAVGLVDYGNLYSAIKFYKAATKNDIKPILGCTVYLCQDIKELKQQKIRAIDHITLLAENQTGWKNLVRLVSDSHQADQFFYFPRVDFNLLEKYKEGLILLSGGVRDSIIGKCFTHDVPAVFKAEAIVRRLLGIFDNNHFYLELQPNEKVINDHLRSLARKYDLQTVVTGNVHYIEQSDAEAHNTLLKMNVSQYNKLTNCDFSQDEFFFRNTIDGFTEEEVSLAEQIADRCNVKIDLKKNRLPKYKYLPQDDTAISYLRRLVHRGLSKICSSFNDNETKNYISRAERELADIDEMGFADYFLIVEDVLSWCRQQGMLLVGS
jgi:DNA polymerase-3 subunit alpha